ncbi:MAG: UvrD-helicase domain-containing protein [Candidatus Omnitrophica bacterium]|nr:UvrD-helicase domain-containing protein [Candidatus Omnitrophota bacterium]
MKEKELSSLVHIVEASAGSGKTYALAKRYLQLLLNPEFNLGEMPIKNILAITFTNKASLEMKERIIGLLKSIALGDTTSNEVKGILDSLSIGEKEAQRKSLAVMETIIHRYNYFQVQTIDKFINAILSGCAFKVGLTSGFRIKTDPRAQIAASFDAVLDRVQEERIAVLLNRFLDNYLFLENRLGWFPKKDILSILHNLFCEMNSLSGNFVLSGISPEDIIKAKRAAFKEMGALYNALPDGTEVRFKSSLEKFIGNNEGVFDIDSLSDYFARPQFPIKKKFQTTKETEKSWEKIRKGLKEISEGEAVSLFDPYIAIFNEVMGHFIDFSRKEDNLFLGELNSKAKQLFDKDYITVEELYYRLAARFRHYLLDEFQDTSFLQWHNLEKMVEEAVSTGGTIFYVGDKKQAIYSFRGGDIRLFDAVKAKFSLFGIKEDRLSNNYRSQKTIVDFNNFLFSPENIEEFITKKETVEGEKEGADKKTFLTREERDIVIGNFKDARQTPLKEKDKGYLSLELIEEEGAPKEEIKTKIFGLIEELIGRFDYKDIAVLTRTNSQVEEVTNWLIEKGLEVESERTSNIKGNNIVEEIIYFLRFLSSPIDNLSFAKFISGDVFTRAAGISSEAINEFLLGLREKESKEKDFYVYREFQKKFASVWDGYIDEFFKGVDLCPLYDLVVGIYGRFDCQNNYYGSQGFLMRFLELIKEKENEYPSLEEFLDCYDEMEGEDLYLDVREHNSIRVMTVHKAKGLQFPVVIIPFLSIGVKVGSQGEDNKISYIAHQEEERISLIKLKKEYYRYSPQLFEVYRGEYIKGLISELNSVYVALTRCEYELYGFIPKKVGNSDNLIRYLLPEGVCREGEKAVYPKRAGRKEKSKLISPSGYCDWLKRLSSEFPEPEVLASRREIQDGELIHRLLSEILTFEGKEDVLSQGDIKQKIKLAAGDESVAKRIYSKMEGFIKDGNIRKLLFVPGGRVLNEVEVCDQSGNMRRIDRMIIKDKEVILVDFKSGEPKDEDQSQVGDYMRLAEGIYPGHKISGYLIYLSGCKIQEVSK